MTPADQFKEIRAAVGLADRLPKASIGLSTRDADSAQSDPVFSPIDQHQLATVGRSTPEDVEWVIASAVKAFPAWRSVPAPTRGELVRQFGEKLREFKEQLGTLVTLEMGKGIQEGLGEVQEMIDICDLAAGMSRQLYGVTTFSERSDHRMYEHWHPYGPTAIISAFNFPVAVWAWNAAIALICGNTIVWKPAPKTPLTAVVCQQLLAQVLDENGYPEGISGLLIGDGVAIGEALTGDRRLPLVSFTGSIRTGRKVAEKVAARLGRSILELGGNNAAIVTPNADLKLAAQYALFGSVGTAGQRCTSTRRVIVHESVLNEVIETLRGYYERIQIGNPLDESMWMGPLVSPEAVDTFLAAIDTARSQGGELLWGGEKLSGASTPGGCYATPAVMRVDPGLPIVQEETFAPLLYLMTYAGDLDQALAIHNGVTQGLSSAVFSDNLRETERFLSHAGSDCGIANVNLGTSGAEIGLAFGGEKDTGGGRESGSDAWKAYMRRQTTTINYSGTIVLAQGIRFGD